MANHPPFCFGLRWLGGEGRKEVARLHFPFLRCRTQTFFSQDVSGENCDTISHARYIVLRKKRSCTVTFLHFCTVVNFGKK